MLRVQQVKRELLLLRRAMRPLVEIVDLLPKLHSPLGVKWIQAKDERVRYGVVVVVVARSADCFYGTQKNLKGNLQEVQKRLKASIELIETYRELCVSIQELSSASIDVSCRCLL